MFNKRLEVNFFTKVFLLFNIMFFYINTKENNSEKIEVIDIDLSENNKLTTISNDYFYSSTFTVGASLGVTRYLKYDNKGPSDMDLDEIEFGNKLNIGGLKGSYNILFSNSFFAKRLGIFPRFGIDADLRGYNFLHRFWTNSPFNFLKLLGDVFVGVINGIKGIGSVMCKRCCSCGPYSKLYKPELTTLNKPEFVFNVFFTFEPETSIYDKVRLIPQIGLGPSFINLYRKTSDDFILKKEDINDVDDRFYKYVLDFGFSFKMILKVITTNNFLNAFHLEFGYNYNPLLLSFLDNKEKSIIDGGIWNFFLSLNYARNMNIGLETVDFFNSKLETSIDKSILDDTIFDRENNKKNTIFLDCGIGIGQWIDISTNRDIKRNICPILQCSFMMPYYGKQIGENHYLSFIGVDVSEDLYTGAFHNKDHNIFFKIVNNLSVSYNFLTLLSDYKGVKFVHKLGVFVPFLTNMLGTFYDTGDTISSYAFSREMIGLENLKDYEKENKEYWLGHLFLGKFTYKFKFYIDLFRLFNKNTKMKTYFYFGGNTIILNRRNDYAVIRGSFNYEIFKIESFNLGISFKFI